MSSSRRRSPSSVLDLLLYELRAPSPSAIAALRFWHRALAAGMWDLELMCWVIPKRPPTVISNWQASNRNSPAILVKPHGAQTWDSWFLQNIRHLFGIWGSWSQCLSSVFDFEAVWPHFWGSLIQFWFLFVSSSSSTPCPRLLVPHLEPCRLLHLFDSVPWGIVDSKLRSISWAHEFHSGENSSPRSTGFVHQTLAHSSFQFVFPKLIWSPRNWFFRSPAFLANLLFLAAAVTSFASISLSPNPIVSGSSEEGAGCCHQPISDSLWYSSPGPRPILILRPHGPPTPSAKLLPAKACPYRLDQQHLSSNDLDHHSQPSSCMYYSKLDCYLSFRFAFKLAFLFIWQKLSNWFYIHVVFPY